LSEWTVEPAEAGTALAAFVRAKTGAAWSAVKRQIATGKVSVGGAVVVEEGRRLGAGDRVALNMAAPRVRTGFSVAIVFEDPQVVVIDKPSGVSSVPYEGETDTAMDLVREAWRRMGRPATSTAIHVVHRIDKETSGLLLFAKSKRAEIALAAQFRAHSVARSYRCVAHGAVRAMTIESRLVEDRGDGLRGSTRFPDQGKRAVTHVTPIEALAGATLCEVRLETGKTHQIRIHLSERGHPLVGERVYIRDFRGPVIESPRLLLHAATLGFSHPVSGESLSFSAALPEDFERVLTRLRGRGSS
jgi:23S rRNA pseudouridine1911/1915/1917 synthase